MGSQKQLGGSSGEEAHVYNTFWLASTSTVARAN